MTKKHEHTPGPWRVVIDDDGNPLSGRPSIQAADEYDCAIVHWDGFVQEYWRSARGDKEIHANAHLIAAAPELLAVAQMVVEASDLAKFSGPLGDAARAAVAKATGASS